MNPEQITQTINGRSVMYRSDRVDITADVLAQLNADWNNRANN
jgi:Skp family chaperone for outer membrane proteins